MGQALSLRGSVDTQPLQRAGKGCMVLLHHMKRSSGKMGSEPLAKQVSTQALSSAAGVWLAESKAALKIMPQHSR